MRRRGFTLIELLVVITIISILAAILFPVFSRAKAAAKSTDCISRQNQLLKGTMLYLSDYDGMYPQTRKSSTNPTLDDASGSLEEPDYGSIFPVLKPYIGNYFSLLICAEDHDAFGSNCLALNPDTPELTSYVYNANFAFGLNESGVDKSSQTILFAERRSDWKDGVQPFCNYVYRPWFNAQNPVAPEDDMDELLGAIATTRHNQRSNYSFSDGHIKNMAWAQTYSPPSNIDLHRVN